MPKAKTSRQKPPRAAETSASPKPQPPMPEPLRKQQYGQTLPGKVAVLESNASLRKTDEVELLDDIVTDVIEGDYLSLREACWNAIRKNTGMKFTWDKLERHAEDVNTLMHWMMAGGWFASFLSAACYQVQTYKRILPEHVLNMVDEAHVNFLCQLQDARELLRNNPGLLIDDIRAAMKSHPDLTEPAE
jgi:hypothetical protein